MINSDLQQMRASTYALDIAKNISQIMIQVIPDGLTQSVTNDKADDDTHLEGVCEPRQQRLETGEGGSDWSAGTAPTEERH